MVGVLGLIAVMLRQTGGDTFERLAMHMNKRHKKKMWKKIYTPTLLHPWRTLSKHHSTTVDSILLRSLKDHYTEVSKMAQPPKINPPSPFTIIKGAMDTNGPVLARNYGEDEEITITVMRLADIIPEAAAAFDSDNDDDQINQLFLHVDVSRNGKEDSLNFLCALYPDAMGIHSVSLRPKLQTNQFSADPNKYGGPTFDDLGEKARDALHLYIEERGVNEELFPFLQAWLYVKDHRNLMRWFKTVGSFITVEYVFPNMSILDLEFIPDESEEEEFHRLYLQMESMWKINKFPDEICLDSINEREKKLWEKSLIGLFKFWLEDEQEVRLVLENGPWSVHGFIMSLKQWIPDNPTNNYRFQEFRLWVQIFGLPLERSTWENIHKIGSALGLVVAIDSVSGSDAGNSFSRVQVMYTIKRRMVRLAASFKFGIGIQSRKVLEWDPKAERMNKTAPMDFKMQTNNRKGKFDPFVVLSSEASRCSEAVLVEKMTVTDVGDLPSIVNDIPPNMDVTFSEAPAYERLQSGNSVTTALTKGCQVNVPLSECAQAELMTSGTSPVSGLGLKRDCMDSIPEYADIVLDNMDSGLNSDQLDKGLNEGLEFSSSSILDLSANGLSKGSDLSNMDVGPPQTSDPGLSLSSNEAMISEPSLVFSPAPMDFVFSSLEKPIRSPKFLYPLRAKLSPKDRKSPVSLAQPRISKHAKPRNSDLLVSDSSLRPPSYEKLSGNLTDILKKFGSSRKHVGSKKILRVSGFVFSQKYETNSCILGTSQACTDSFEDIQLYSRKRVVVSTEIFSSEFRKSKKIKMSDNLDSSQGENSLEIDSHIHATPSPDHTPISFDPSTKENDNANKEECKNEERKIMVSFKSKRKAEDFDKEEDVVKGKRLRTQYLFDWDIGGKEIMSSSEDDGSMGITPTPSLSDSTKSHSFSKDSSNPSAFSYGPGDSDSRSSKRLILVDSVLNDSEDSEFLESSSKGLGSSSSGSHGSGDNADEAVCSQGSGSVGSSSNASGHGGYSGSNGLSPSEEESDGYGYLLDELLEGGKKVIECIFFTGLELYKCEFVGLWKFSGGHDYIQAVRGMGSSEAIK
ncbi:hypothetical protein IFM89_000395 [Coptis chinensis]|uniref:DUF4283 domain-containing protein n=1 Tax=Coptis chinensis TaxID=261450 RepID=A0A835LK60_9MAGN|nr:hypothetical protein IFM89_000395 [Coptis chinensis]